MPELRPYVSLFEDINVAKKVKSLLASDYTKEQAEELKKKTDEYTKKLEPYIEEIGKKYRGNDKDNIVKLLINHFAFGDDGRIKRIGEDFQTFMTYVDAYFHHNQKGFNWDTGDLITLKKIVEPYLEKKAAKQATERAGTEETDHIFENENWIVVSPKSEKAACAWGKGTDWCTAKPSDEGYSNYFDTYHQQGRLVIIQSKKDPKIKYQLHAQSKQFMDRNDYQVDVDEIVGAIGPDVEEAIAAWLKKVGDLSSKPMTIDDVIENYVGELRDSLSHDFIKKVFSDPLSLTSNWDFPANLEEAYSNLKHQDVTKINELCHKVLTAQKMAYDDSEDFPELIRNFPDALAEIKSALLDACRDAMTSGAESDMYNDVVKKLTNIMKENGIAPVDGNWKTHFSDNKFIQNYSSLSEIFDERDKETIEESYGGWSGFDKEYFKERFADLIQEQGMEFSWESAKDLEVA